MRRLSELAKQERAYLAEQDAEHVARLETAMARIDPEHEWCSDEWAKRMDLLRTVRHRMDLLHRDQRHYAPIIEALRLELAERLLLRALARWVQDLIDPPPSPALPTH